MTAPELIGLLAGIFLVSVGLYVWLVITGTRWMFTPKRKLWGYVLTLGGILLFGLGVGFVASVIWAVVFGAGSIIMGIFMTVMTGTLIAVPYIHFQDPANRRIRT